MDNKVHLLSEELKRERKAHEEAEQQAEMWRQGMIAAKIDSVHSKREKSEVNDIADFQVDNRSFEQSLIENLKAERSYLLEQQQALVSALEDLHCHGDDRNTDGSVEEQLAHEKQMRKAGVALVEALRRQCLEAVKRKEAEEKNNQDLQKECTRLRTLLFAAEDVIMQNGINIERTPIERLHPLKITEGIDKSRIAKQVVTVALCAISTMVVVRLVKWS